MIPISKVWYPNKEKLHAYIDKIYETGWGITSLTERPLL